MWPNDLALCENQANDLNKLAKNKLLDSDLNPI